MTFRDDERGASVQVGAILLFGFIVLAIAGWQAQVVPQDNAEVEYTHNQRVTDDMQDVRNEIVSAPGRTAMRSIAVHMAPEYPPRTLFVNPGSPSGTVRTVGTTNASINLTVANAEATADNVDDFWDGTPRTYNTGGLAYEPGYHVYTDAPDTVYENTVLYDAHEDGTTVGLAGQDMVEGRTISLVTLNGSLDLTTDGNYPLDLEALSSSSRTVTVTNSTSGPITISFASRHDAQWWNATLQESGELDEDGGYVTDVRSTSLGQVHQVTVELQGDTTYVVRMAKVGLGSKTAETDEAYVTDVEGNNTRIRTGETQRLVVEVRDRYNNPVSGVTVRNNTTGTVLNGGSLDAESKTTGENGRVTFEFTGGTTGTATIQFNISDDVTPLERELVTFAVDVSGGGGDSTGPLTTNVQTSPSGPYLEGDSFTLSADVSDIQRGGTQIIAAEWYRNTSGDPGLGSANQMSASDGTFDTVEESVEDSVDTTGWSAGDHELYVRGQDANGNWGVEDSIVVTVSSGSPPSVDTFTVTDNSKCQGNNDNVEYGVDWDVSDTDGNLDTVTVTLEDSTGTQVDSSTTQVSGGAASGTDTLQDTNGCGTDYTVSITVTDQVGNTDSQSTVDNADGN